MPRTKVVASNRVVSDHRVSGCDHDDAFRCVGSELRLQVPVEKSSLARSSIECVVWIA